MRTSVVLLLSLSTAATFVNAKPKEEGEGGGGALQALLERMQKTKHDNDHSKRGLKDAQVRPPPSDYSNGPDSFEQDLNNSTTSRSSRSSSSNKTRLPESVESESSESATASSKFTKSTDRPSRHHKARPSPSSESESPSKSRLRSTDAPRRPLSVKREDLPTSALEKKLRVAESNNPFADEEFDSLTAAKPSTTAADKSSNKKGESTVRLFEVTFVHSAHLEICFRTVQEKTFGKKEQHEDKKRWVWATQILQDDTPEASGVPPPGQNANLLNSIPVNTPAATLVAPSFPPVAPAAAVVVESSSLTPAAATTSRAARQPITNRKKPAAAPAQAPVAKDKRWTWGTSIIQDGDSNAPPVGENANLLSSGTTIALNTPVAQLTPPSFPPLAEPTQAVAAQDNSGAGGAQAAAQVVESASSTLSAVAAEVTSPVGTSDIQNLLVKLQEQIDALASAYSQASATSDAVDAAAETSPAENAKRWVWGPSIIQDDTPSSEAPPIGQNTNLFNPSMPVATPTGKPLAPNYNGRIGLASVAVPVPVSVEAPVQEPVTPPVVDPASASPSPSSSSSSVHRNRKSEADSIRSVKAAAPKTAALEWHLANQKRKVGGMAKQHKRQ
ncbi:hypothetical protein JCM5350_004784 [Sporobolomyces pararoseus]